MRAATNRAMAPGWPKDKVRLSWYCCLKRSTSSALKVGRRATSAKISIACKIFADITPTVALEESQRAPEFNEPPRASIVSAICVASRLCVPLVSRLAVMSASPGNSGGSTSPPFLIVSCAVINGVSDRSMTIRRNPFASVCSTGFGNCTERGGAGGGGVACGVCALATNGNTRRAPIATKRSARLKTNPVLFTLPALLARLQTVVILRTVVARLRSFGQVIQNQPVSIGKIFLHHSLYVCRSYSL